MERSEEAGKPKDRTIWLRWVLAHTLVLGMAWAFGLWFLSKSGGFGIIYLFPFIPFVPFVAQGIGVAGTLRPEWEIGRWLLATLGGGVLGIAVLMLGLWQMHTPAVFPILGAILGVVQMLVLRRHTQRAVWWVVANSVGVGVGVGLGYLIYTTVESGCSSSDGFGNFGASYCSYAALVLGVVVGVAVFSSITGAALVWMLRERVVARSAE